MRPTWRLSGHDSSGPAPPGHTGPCTRAEARRTGRESATPARTSLSRGGSPGGASGVRQLWTASRTMAASRGAGGRPTSWVVVSKAAAAALERDVRGTDSRPRPPEASKPIAGSLSADAVLPAQRRDVCPHRAGLLDELQLVAHDSLLFPGHPGSRAAETVSDVLNRFLSAMSWYSTRGQGGGLSEPDTRRTTRRGEGAPTAGSASKPPSAGQESPRT